MNLVTDAFNSDNLALRAIDFPRIVRGNDGFIFDCTEIANEFDMLMSNKGMSSVSATLLIQGEHVATYKSIGFLVDARKADCFHISKTDSGSSGNMVNGDFSANKPDFENIKDLAEYIKKSKSKDINEINMNLNINAVLGLVYNAAVNEELNQKAIIIIQKAISKLTGYEFPIYRYNRNLGTVEPSLVSEEEKNNIMQHNNKYNTDKYGYFLESSPDYVEESLNFDKDLGNNKQII
jgi:hypothetical protein